MELPMEIPRELAEIAVPVEVAGPGESYPAWSREDALAVVECLRGTKVAIEGGEVFRTDRLGLRTAIEIWDCERIAAETATDYAERSRDMARGRIEATPAAESGDLLYALTFSDQQEAA